MDLITKVYGYIAAWDDPGESPWPFLNRERIAALPENDTYPVLTRDMFAVADGYGGQMITFGRFYRDLVPAWDAWRAKFEALLTSLTWNGAQVFVESESHGTYDCVWRRCDGQADGGQITQQAWSYSGLRHHLSSQTSTQR